jgi:dipeptidase D
MANEEVYLGLEPREVWRHFAALNEIPRPSGQERAAINYVRNLAQSLNATCYDDLRGNMVVRVPATSGHENAPAVAIQAHLDMVCEKRPDVEHDFAHDPILVQRQGDRLSALGTTLGADNGIGAAMAVATLTTPQLVHGPLELLFTVEEETGLYGATELDPALLSAPFLINIDSEDPDEITVGCAGGSGVFFYAPLEWQALDGDWAAYNLTVSGLQGGHSGIQISEPLANAIKVLSRVLLRLRVEGVDVRLSSLNGGKAHNAIPRDATATLVVPTSAQSQLGDVVMAATAELLDQWVADEPDLAITLEAESEMRAVWTGQSAGAVMSLVENLPHGVLAMSENFEDKVQTSANVASVITHGNEVEMHVSIRSFANADIVRVAEQISEMGASVGARTQLRDGYPGWEPNPDSQLLEVAKAAYADVYGKAPSVQVVHAGLECGILTGKRPGLDAISFGPLIRGPHTPEEWVSISSVGQTWQMLVALLERLAKG